MGDAHGIQMLRFSRDSAREEFRDGLHEAAAPEASRVDLLRDDRQNERGGVLAVVVDGVGGLDPARAAA